MGVRLPSVDGKTLALGGFKGRALLVANTASFCGYTYQYEGLQQLHAAKSPGLTVIGVPSQHFNQEAADNATVKTVCETRFDIDFPLTAICSVTGPKAAPFYAWVKAQKQWQPQWNFNKVLIGRDGRTAGMFRSRDESGGVALTQVVDAELARAM